MEKKRVDHSAFPAEYDADAEILILGSIPSPISREEGFYYANPRNRFWRVLSAVFEEPLPKTTEERKDFVHRHRIALWDALSSCLISGASDGSIEDPVPTDIPELLKRTKIRRIYCSGRAAQRFYEKLSYPRTGLHSRLLPSTSPANCALSLERLIEECRVIREES